VRLGEWGEAQAAALLRRKGFRIVAQNFRTRYGELDIVAEKDGFLVFAEVKTRKNDRFAAAREAVDARKQERLRVTAELWLQGHPTGLQPRFDVIEVYGGPGTEPRLVHIENAF